VASTLQVTLLENVAATIELGGTRDPAAFDAYLRGSKAVLKHDAQSLQAAIAAFSEAIRLDPNYALAFAHRSFALSSVAEEFEAGRSAQIADFDRAQADARRTIALAPDLSEGHRALAAVFDTETLDFTQASEEYDRAMALAPGNADILGFYGRFAVYMGRTESGIAAARRAVVVDPLNPRSHRNLLQALFAARRYEETLTVYQDLLVLNRDDPRIYGLPGLAHYALGHFENARATCEIKPDYWLNQLCLAVAYEKLGRHQDAQAALAKIRASLGDAAAYQYADIYAQWGDTVRALECLDTALRLRDSGLEGLKTDPLLDPLRREPRYLGIERALKFPVLGT
jgi:tetratricopeptide (TPR) repeat protein